MAFELFKHFRTRATPQHEPIPGSGQVANSAGGFAFAVDDWGRLERFLVLGTEGGSYYASERSLTISNAEVVARCLDVDAERTIATIVSISDSGRAPKNDPAVLALAIAAGTGHTGLAMAALPKVCRTGTHLFQFATAVEGLRGWGRGLRKGTAAWYERLSADDLAYQVVKYQRREGWSHRDLLRLAHPVTTDAGRQAVYRWVVGGMDALGARTIKRGEASVVYDDVSAHLPRLIQAMEKAKTANLAQIVELIRKERLPRECVPTEHLNNREVWQALLEGMPLTAMVRNLAKMTSVGLLTPGSKAAGLVRERLADETYLHKSRVHPLAILLAAATYKRGRGLKGKLTWEPVQMVNDALDEAFYLAFANVEPSNRRTLIGLDVSGSMSCGQVAGTPLTPRAAAAALTLLTAKTEPTYQVMAFHDSLVPFDMAGCSRLTDVIERTTGLPFGGTDCALPMQYALAHRLDIDTFIVLTDNETWAGPIHPAQALREYREKSGIGAKLIVVGMVSNGFSIADPNDAGMLDVVGFDANAPMVMTDFARS